MTVTPAHIDRARAAVSESTRDTSWETNSTVDAWLHKNSAFATLVELVAMSLAHNYRPTIRPVSNGVKAYREAEMVANAYDAACSWAFDAEARMCAYRGDTPTFRRNLYGKV